jgi:hypothetical protein
MSAKDKNRLASLLIETHTEFEMALSDNSRKYPIAEFKRFVRIAQQYLEAIQHDQFVHKEVVRVLHGLSENLRLERKKVPDDVLYEAERLECLLFLGYDPHFEGDEPPGL